MTRLGRYLSAGRTEAATKAELLIFFERLEAELENSGFFHVAERRPSMVRNIRNIFQRADLTEQEVRTLHGIVSGLIRRHKGKHGHESSDWQDICDPYTPRGFGEWGTQSPVPHQFTVGVATETTITPGKPG